MSEPLYVKDVINSIDTLKYLIEQDVKVKTAVKLKHFINEVDNIYSIYEDKRKKLVQKYGEQDEQGKSSVTDENKEIFMKEIKQVMDEEVNIDLEKINIDELDKIDIKTSNLITIEWMLDID